MKKVDKDKKKKEVKKNEKDIIFIILVVILVIMSLTIIMIRLINGKSLNIEKKEIKELHNYFNTDDLTNCSGLFNYDEKKLTYNDTNAENKLCLAYYKTDLSGVEKVEYDLDKKTKTCNVDDMIFKNDEDSKKCVVSKIEKDVLAKTYKKLFGKDIEENASFRVSEDTICYLKDGYYYCGISDSYLYTIGNEAKVYRSIDRAYEKGSRIVIYDYFLKVAGDSCYATYTSSVEDAKCTKNYTKNKKVDIDFLLKNGTKYKHIYEKAKDGTYYWVSSEPVK